MNAAIACSKVATPYFSAISEIRAAPMRTDAIAAQTSPSRTSGMRELTFMISITGRIGSPRETTLMAGSLSPS